MLARAYIRIVRAQLPHRQPLLCSSRAIVVFIEELLSYALAEPQPRFYPRAVLDARHRNSLERRKALEPSEYRQRVERLSGR